MHRVPFVCTTQSQNGTVTAFYVLVSEEQALELSFGRVPALVQEMARAMTDWTQEDMRRNAAKPVQRGAIKTRRTAPPKRAAKTRKHNWNV